MATHMDDRNGTARDNGSLVFLITYIRTAVSGGQGCPHAGEAGGMEPWSSVSWKCNHWYQRPKRARPSSAQLLPSAQSTTAHTAFYPAISMAAASPWLVGGQWWRPPLAVAWAPSVVFPSAQAGAPTSTPTPPPVLGALEHTTH